MSVKVGIPSQKITQMEDTIDYVRLQEIIQTCFKYPKDLLEELITDIQEEIHLAYPRQLKYLWLSIKKMNPPLALSTECSELILEEFYD